MENRPTDTDDEQNAKTNTGDDYRSSNREQHGRRPIPDGIDVVHKETGAAFPPGNGPYRDKLTLFMRREEDWYDKGVRHRIITLDAADYENPVRGAKGLAIRYVEAFDQLLLRFDAEDFATLREEWSKNDGRPRADGGQEVPK